jgi:hypothetical protein
MATAITPNAIQRPMPGPDLRALAIDAERRLLDFDFGMLR